MRPLPGEGEGDVCRRYDDVVKRGDRSSCHRKGEIITTVIVWLLLGAIVNVAVAWGFSIWSTARYDEDRLSAGQSWDLDAYNRRHAVKVCLAFGSWTYGRAGVVGARWHQMASTKAEEAFLDDCGGYHIHFAGWPKSALYCVGSFVSQPQIVDGELLLPTAWTGGVSSPAFLRPKVTPFYLMPSIERPLPVSPLWPGFAVNTLFYAAILWLLFAAPFAVRRWRRIKRGLCPKCAYDLRGSPSSGDSSRCPECGPAMEGR